MTVIKSAKIKLIALAVSVVFIVTMVSPTAFASTNNDGETKTTQSAAIVDTVDFKDNNSPSGDVSLSSESLQVSAVYDVDFDPGVDNIQPRFAWGKVINVLLSRPACEAARNFYNSQFPNMPKLKCRKKGSVWILTR